MNKRLRIGAVSYLNTKPLVYGIKHLGLLKEIDFVEDFPASIADKLIKNQIDIGLIPVAAIPQIPTAQLFSNYCIGANEEVASVALFADLPLEQLTKVYLDYQSRSSVKLFEILLKEYWKRDIELVPAPINFQSKIGGTVGAVIIGDRAFEQKQKSLYMVDLAKAWKDHTGLPFVFATWVANKAIPPEFQKAFDQANAYGLSHLEDVIAEIPVQSFDLMHYYTQNISYEFDQLKKQGLQLFLSKLQSLK